MLLLEQLELRFHAPASGRLLGRDPRLEAEAANLLRSLGANRIAASVAVEWNARLRSAAGRADYRARLITLNPRLHEHGVAEIDRTLRHELAHLLAQFRAGRRRVAPHGAEWRAACRELGIVNEARCHTLPFPVRRRRRGYLYRCPKCERDFPRVHQIRRPVACLACCRRFAGGAFDRRFLLRLVENSNGQAPK